MFDPLCQAARRSSPLQQHHALLWSVPVRERSSGAGDSSMRKLLLNSSLTSAVILSAAFLGCGESRQPTTAPAGLNAEALPPIAIIGEEKRGGVLWPDNQLYRRVGRCLTRQGAVDPENLLTGGMVPFQTLLDIALQQGYS